MVRRSTGANEDLTASLVKPRSSPSEKPSAAATEYSRPIVVHIWRGSSVQTRGASPGQATT